MEVRSKKLFSYLNIVKTTKKEILNDLKFLTTAHILLVVVIDKILEFSSKSGSDAHFLAILKCYLPITFLFFSIIIVKYLKEINEPLNKNLNLLISLYLLSFGFFILFLPLTIYYSFIIPLFSLSFILISIMPAFIFSLLGIEVMKGNR